MTRCFNSFAALLVNVTAKIWCQCAWPVMIMKAILCTIVLVLPDPAPARTRRFSCVLVAASRCSGFKVSMICVMSKVIL